MTEGPSPPEDSDAVVRAIIESGLGGARAPDESDWRSLIERFPGHADWLNSFLPVLASLERLGAEGGRPGSAAEATSGVAGGGATDPLDSLKGRILGDFLIMGAVGGGGMGRVYEAVQISLCRRVAVKVLRSDVGDRETAAQRFLNESYAAAQLHHPHIVSVHSVGSEQGVVYFAMDFIDGAALDQLIAARRSASGPPANVREEEEGDGLAALPGLSERDWFRAAAKIGVQVADALHCAHEAGVLHRDVKPSNILLDRSAQAFVADFGVARLAQGPDLTSTGEVLGTLRYLSPERARDDRNQIDRRSDVYSLGVTLYELATLQPVFGDVDREALWHRIFHEEPTPPGRLSANLPRDLETIILKAMRKAPEDRYASCRDLADDLRRFLADSPIAARRPLLSNELVRTAFAAWKFLASAAVLLIALWLGGSMPARQRSQQPAPRQDEAVTSEGSRPSSAEHQYVADLQDAQSAWDRGSLGEMRRLLERWRSDDQGDDRRDFQWGRLWAMLENSPPPIGRHEGPAYFARFAADGKRFVTTGGDGVILWDAASRRRLHHFAFGGGDVNWASFSPDGTLLATAGDDGVLRLIDIESRKPLREVEFPSPLVAAEFSSDSPVLAVAERRFEGRGEDRITLLEVEQGRTLSVLHPLGDARSLHGVAFSGNATGLACAAGNGVLVHWPDRSDPTRSDQVAAAGQRACNCVALSPDGAWVMAGNNDGSLLVHSTRSAERRILPGLHANGIESLDFATTGDKFLTAGRDGEAKLWSWNDEAPFAPVLLKRWKHERPLWCGRLSPDGLGVVMVDGAGGVHWRPIQEPSPAEPLRIPAGDLYGWMGFPAHDLVAVCARQAVQGWSAKSGRLLWQTPPIPHLVSMAVHPTRESLLVVTAHQLILLDARRGTRLHAWDVAEAVRDAAPWGSAEFDRTGVMAVLLAGANGRVDRVLHLDLRESVAVSPQVLHLPQASRGIQSVAADPLRIGMLDSNGVFGVWSEQDQDWRELGPTICASAWSPDGDSLYGLDLDGKVSLWDGASYRRQASWIAESGGGSDLAISPDGRTLATAGALGRLSVWNRSTRRRLTTLEMPSTMKSTARLAFSPDGGSLAAKACPDDRFEIWVWRGSRLD